MNRILQKIDYKLVLKLLFLVIGLGLIFKLLRPILTYLGIGSDKTDAYNDMLDDMKENPIIYTKNGLPISPELIKIDAEFVANKLGTIYHSADPRSWTEDEVPVVTLLLQYSKPAVKQLCNYYRALPLKSSSGDLPKDLRALLRADQYAQIAHLLPLY